MYFLFLLYAWELGFLSDSSLRKCLLDASYRAVNATVNIIHVVAIVLLLLFGNDDVSVSCILDMLCFALLYFTLLYFCFSFCCFVCISCKKKIFGHSTNTAIFTITFIVFICIFFWMCCCCCCYYYYYTFLQSICLSTTYVCVLKHKNNNKEDDWDSLKLSECVFCFFFVAAAFFKFFFGIQWAPQQAWQPHWATFEGGNLPCVCGVVSLLMQMSRVFDVICYTKIS